MAGFVSTIASSVPLCASHSQTKGVPRKSVLDKFVCRHISETASKLLSLRMSKRGVHLANERFNNYTAAFSRHYCEVIFPCTSASSCTCVVLAGYWVGPDDDDGWGYVEAYVNHTT